MTATRVATIVRCADMLRHVYETVASIERQSVSGGEVVLVTDSSTPAAAQPWLADLARARSCSIAHATGSTPGSVWNAGIRVTGAPYVMCVEAGDLLSPSFHEAASARLDEETPVDLVTSGVQWLGPGGVRHATTPTRVDLEALVADTETIHSASMFRRQAWIELNGFDETLPALEAYEFWLRLLADGRRCEVVEQPLLIRPLRQDTLYRRAWDREPHMAAVARILGQHTELFARDPATALYGREQQLREAAAQYREAVARRDDSLREIETLKARAVELRDALPTEERDAVNLGDLNRTTPVAGDWGYERGQPIDRYYIERFLERHASDIRGIVLEIQEADYTLKFGGGGVTRSDVLDLDASNPRATVISDLRSANNIQSHTYDCVILTQTIHVVDDVHAVLSECARILRPGGVLLATLPSASRVCLEYGHDGDFWRVTEAGARHLFAEIFPAEALEVEAFGNVLVNAAFLYGLGCHELSPADFDAVDPYFPLIVTVKARKPASPPSRLPALRQASPPSGLPALRRTSRSTSGPQDKLGAAILLYHRVGTPHSDVHGLSVSPQDFRAQMAHVRERYHPMPLRELVAAARAGGMPNGGIAVTFDDGYVDNYTDASPILMESDVPATFFVTTDRLDEDGEYWWDTLERLLLSPARPTPPALRVELPGGTRDFATMTFDERCAAHAGIYEAIAGSPAGVRNGVIDALIRWGDQPALHAPHAQTHRRMRSAELLAMAARHGHAVGAHSVRHLMLPRQTLDTQRDEIASSRRALETLLNREVRDFAYPFGAYSDEVVEHVLAAGFEMAVTCDDALLVPPVDPLRIPRLEVTPRHSAAFAEWLSNRLKDCYEV